MSYSTRGTAHSPMTTFGLGTMTGNSSGSRGLSSTYSSSYRNRTPSATRNSTLYGGSSSTRVTSRPPSGSSRPLPTGPGPLDTSGRPIKKYSTSDYGKNSFTSSTRSTPLKADHSYLSSTSNYSPSIGTLPRKYSPSTSTGLNSTTKDTVNRTTRSRSVVNLDRDFGNLKLNGYDSVKASPRAIDSDDNVFGRSSRKDRYNYEQTKLDDNLRSASRVSRGSIISDNKSINNDDGYTPRDGVSRMSSQSRDIVTTNRKNSITDGATTSKSLSRQSSSSSISNQGNTMSKYSSCGKVGLRNIGNTCFMNCVIQCLSNTKQLLEYCLNENYVLDKNKTTSKLKGALIIAYANLITSFWKDKSSTYVTPNSFKSQIQKFAPRFTGYQQQDAQEFLRYLLEGLHEDVNRVTSKPKPLSIDDDNFTSDSEKAAEYWNNYLRFDHSRIVEIFVGQLKSELKFDECGHRSTTFDPFWDLSLPIPKSSRYEVDITDCLKDFMREEILEGDESPTCAKCKKRRSCTKRFSIQKFPPVLVFHLKRFSQERYSRKITNLVNFPITSLDLTEFASEKGQRPTYNLYGVSEHSGTTHGGHYTAKCKHPYTGEWNDFNDTRVSPCGANQAVSSEAYVLFYELQGGQSRL